MQDLLREDVDGVGNQDGEGYHDRGLPQPGPQRQDDASEGETDEHSAPPISKKLRPASHTENAPLITAATATLKATRPVPSLTRLTAHDRANALWHA